MKLLPVIKTGDDFNPTNVVQASSVSILETSCPSLPSHTNNTPPVLAVTTNSLSSENGTRQILPREGCLK